MYCCKKDVINLKELSFIIETISPVVFAEKNNDSTLYTTKKYITGTALRGSLAQRFINYKKLGSDAHKNADFYDIFLSGKVKFLPAYPIGGDADNEQYDPFMLPLSFMKHKSTNCIIDLSGEDSKPEAGYKKCTGFAMRRGSTWYKVEPQTQIQLHMARSKDSARITGRSQDGDIFNYEYIEPHQYFKGSCIVTDDTIADTLSHFLQKNVQVLYVGHSRQAQYGKCEITMQKPTATSADMPCMGKDVYLYAYTPYIPFTPWQRTDDLANSLLTTIEAKLQQKYPNVTLHKDGLNLFAASEEIGGYVQVWHTRQERKTALSAGSLIQFKADHMPDEAVPYLQEILFGGLGWRTTEGLGQFRLWQSASDITLKELTVSIPSKPESLQAVEQNVRNILQNRLLTEIKKEAKDRADNTILTGNKKHILTRIEELMESNRTKAEIQTAIRSFKKKGQDNLHMIYINKDDLYDLLLEENGAVQPYAHIHWEDRLGLKSRETEELKKDFGPDIFRIDEDTVYTYFWLWFVRHARKRIVENSSDH